MQCTEFAQYAERWMEGERSPAAVAHHQECARCRRFVDQLDAIVGAAATLDEFVPAPPERVWLSLRSQLEAEGLIRQRTVGGWFSDLFAAVPQPALAAGYLAVLLVAALLGGLNMTSTKESVALLDTQNAVLPLEPQYAEKTEQGTVSVMHDRNPAVTASYRENLAIVDKFIAACEKTVREDPRNQVARDYLYGAYQQKADLLATMTERGAE